MICKENPVCHNAACAFGFKPLAVPLKTGKGLVGFGITEREEVGIRMFEGMTVFEERSIDRIEVFPIEEAHESSLIPHVLYSGPHTTILSLSIIIHDRTEDYYLGKRDRGIPGNEPVMPAGFL